MEKWEILGYVAAIFNPLPTGMAAGYFLYTDKKYKKTGRNVLLVSVLLLAILLVLTFGG